MTKPRAPIKATINRGEQVKLALMALLQIILWLAMFIAGANVLIFWVYELVLKGPFDPTTVQYSIVVAVGAYFCLIIDKSKINEVLKINTELPFIGARTKKNGSR